jgi:hypothetical protein
MAIDSHRAFLGSEFKRIYRQLSEPALPNTKLLLDLWRECQDSGGLVIGQDVPSRAVAPILRNLIVYEPVSDFADFHVRLAGSGYLAHYGYDVTGKAMSELFDPETFLHNLHYGRQVVETQTPLLFLATLTEYGIARGCYELALLPVLASDRVTKWMLVGAFPCP